MLPDDVWLEIFDFYVNEDTTHTSGDFETWITLAHVCRRWRSLVFRSPHRLNLQLVCTPNTRARDTLDIWPPLPLIISDLYNGFCDYDDLDDIITALEHNDRVCQINLRLCLSELKSVTDSAAMQKPFPELTDLRLNTRIFTSPNGPELILPDSFLDRSAPHPRTLWLRGIAFFHHCRNYFHLPIASSHSALEPFLILDTFHPTRWPLPCQ